MAYREEVRREVWKITERRDGAIYNTESCGLVWVPLDEVCGQRSEESWEQYMMRTSEYEKRVAKERGGDFLSSISSSIKDFNE